MNKFVIYYCGLGILGADLGGPSPEFRNGGDSLAVPRELPADLDCRSFFLRSRPHSLRKTLQSQEGLQMAAALSMPTSREGELLAYVADLELEVDRLRKQAATVQQAAHDSLHQILSLCKSGEHESLGRIADVAGEFAALLCDVRELPGYHPAHDQVVALAIRPLIEQVFRWQQRLQSAPYVSLHLELGQEHVNWFPARLRHILENLISNALRFRDSTKGESRLTVGLIAASDAYELRITDNGMGMLPEASAISDSLELFHRSSPARSAGLGIGLAVVKVLIQQSGGTLETQTDSRHGTSFLLTLPRYDVNDFLT